MNITANLSDDHIEANYCTISDTIELTRIWNYEGDGDVGLKAVDRIIVPPIELMQFCKAVMAAREDREEA